MSAIHNIQALCAALMLAALAAPTAAAQVTFTHTAEEMRTQGDFCAKQQIGMAGRYRGDSPEAQRFNTLKTCEQTCYGAAQRLSSPPVRPMVQNGIDACNTSFNALPAELRAELGAAPDPDAAPVAAAMTAKAEECAQLAEQYPRLAADRRNANFGQCNHTCSMAAQEIERAGANVGNFQTRCEAEYTGAMARLPAGN